MAIVSRSASAPGRQRNLGNASATLGKRPKQLGRRSAELRIDAVGAASTGAHGQATPATPSKPTLARHSSDAWVRG